MAINVPLNAQLQNATQLQQQIQNAVNSVRINLGGQNGARALSSLSQPLGRLTGQADEFTKSLDAANARVLAFGASVGVVNAVTSAFKSLVNSTIEVEKAITAISVVGDQFTGKTKELGQGLFKIAKETGQSFSEVSKAALEFSRQGLLLEDTLSRTQDALILTRLTGLDAAKSVDGLTAAFNAFSKAGLSTTQIVNKLAAVDQAFAVSSADLIEGFNRSAAVAQNAGVTFDELAGIITALQQETSRGGAVIGNALKTIFTRLQDTSTLNNLQNLGVAVQDLQGNLLPARQILQNLATDVEGLSQITKAGIFKDVAGTFQINQLISLVGDLNKENSIAAGATLKSAGASNEAYIANEKLNQSLDAILGKLANTGKQLGSVLGELGLTDNLKGLLDGINYFLEGANNLLQGDDIGSRFAKGFVKGIGAVLSGPGLGIFLAIIGKLSLDLVKFGTQSLKAFFGIGKAAADQKLVQESIVQTLIRNQSIANAILSTQGGQNAQALKFLGLLNQQAAAMQTIQGVAGGIAPTVYTKGYRATPGGLQRNSAGGYLPAQEASDVRRGVGGASPSSKVVSIPNFAFGSGKRGTMIANTSEYIVPNYAGGGSAIFNQDMVKSMGLPAGAKKISAAGGFVPNFSPTNKLKAGRDLESRIFNFFGLPPAGNRNLDFPEGVLTGVSSQLKNQIGLKGSFGDLKLTNSQYNQTSLLGRLIQEFDLFDELNKSLYKKKNAQNVNLNSLNPKVGKSSLFFPGDPNIFEPKDISASWAAIRKANKNKPNFLSKFDSIIYGSDGSLKSGAIGSKVSAKILIDGVSDPQNTASGGYIPNFAENDTNNQLAILGLYGKNGNIDGSPVYTLSSQRPNLFKDIKGNLQKNVTNLVKSYASRIGKKINVPVVQKDIKKSLNQIPSMSGFMFEDVLNQLAGPNFDTATESSGSRIDFPLTQGLREVFGVTGPQKYAEAKLDPYTADAAGSVRAKQKALAAGALGPQERTGDALSALRARAIELRIGVSGRPSVRGGKEGSAPVPTQAEKNAFIKKLIDDGIIESDIKNSADQSKAIKRKLGIASGGYIPNFADLDGDGIVTQEDGFYKRLKSAAKKYSKNPLVDFALNQVLQSMLGLPEGIEVTEIIRACDKSLKAMQPEMELNEILRKKKADKQPQKRREILATRQSSSGYIPNFAAAALQQAIAREKSAGLSNSQIYVDQNSSLKSSMNPMGLMVANRRDEPAGGFQGIARARKEGMNPKLYGAANGFVPNYALSGGATPQAGFGPAPSTTNQSVSNNQNQIQKQTKSIQDSIGSLISLQVASSALTGILSEAGETAQKFGSALGGALIGLQGIKELGKAEGGVSFGNLRDFKSSKSSREITAGFSRLGTANRTRSLSTLASGLGLVTKGLLRFAPLIGQVVLGFDILNGVLKAFGVDIVKIVTDKFRGVNDAGQEAKESIENFAKILDEQGGKISSQKGFELLKERANVLGEKLLFRTAGLNPKTEEDLAKARTQLVNDQIDRTFSSLTGKSISANVVEIGQRREERPLRGGGSSFSTVQQIKPDSVFEKSIVESYRDSLKVLQNLDEESVNKIAKNQGLLGKDFVETKNNLLKSAIESINEQLKFAIDPSKTKGLTEEYKTDIFKSLSADRIFGKFASILDNTQEQTEAFEKRLEQNVELFLIEEEKFFNRVNRDFSNAIDFFSSLTSTKAFSSLAIGEQTNLLNTLDIGKSQQTFIKNLTDFRNQAAKTLLEDFRKNALKTGLTSEQKGQIENFIIEFNPANIQAFNEELANFVKTLGGVDKQVFNALNKTANSLSDQQTDLLSKRQNELKLLEFSIIERNSETRAIQYFNKEVVKFGKTIVDSEKEIQDFNSKIKILDLQTDFDTAISDAFALSSRQALSDRQGIELKSVSQKAGYEASIAEKQAKIDLQRTLYTKENIVALNKNTETLRELADIQSIAVENSLKQEKDRIANRFGEMTGGESIDDLLTNLTPEAQSLQQQYKQLSNVLNAISSRRTASLTGKGGFGSQGTDQAKSFKSVDDMIKGYQELVAKGQSPEQAIQSYVQNLGYSEESTIIVRDALLEYSRTLDKENNGRKNLLTETEKAQKLEAEKNILLETYAAALSNQIKSADDALKRPMSVGQFAAQTRAQRTSQRMLQISERGIEDPIKLRKENAQEYDRLTALNNPAVREYMSSFGYGFDEAMGKIEERTLDFRNQLGKEIPDLFSSNLSQGLNDAISGAKDLKTALTDAATAFFQEITRKNISNLADMVTGGIGGFFTKKASGGLISGGSGTKDDVPAMLMGGEYVVKKSAVNKYGKGFLDALNNGKMRGYATGGLVDPETFPTQTGRGGFYTPGDYGQGAITGKNELLTFATQSSTSGQYDYMGGFGMGGASVSLEAESARLSSSGRENSPMFERVQQSKDQAFQVYLEGLQKEKEYAELLDQIAKDKKARKKALQSAIITAVASAALSYGASALAAGGMNAVSAASETAAAQGKTLSGLSKAGTWFKGALGTGGASGYGGLGNAFKGNFGKATVNFQQLASAQGSEAIYNMQGGAFKGVTVGNKSYPIISGGGGLPLPARAPNNFGLGLKANPLLPSNFNQKDPFFQSRASGGLISGGSNIRDDVPAMLTGGEFVLNNRATQRIGVQNLNQLNNGQSVGGEGASSEMTQALISKLDELIQATQNSSSENVVVNVSSNEAGGQNQENTAGAEKELHKKIRQAVLDVIAQEKRLGGSLEKSR